jgi:hypothetical protein
LKYKSGIKACKREMPKEPNSKLLNREVASKGEGCGVDDGVEKHHLTHHKIEEAVSL